MKAGASRERKSQSDVEEIAEAIRRDLEDLLNTRNDLGPELAPRYPESARSILCYGLVDIDGPFLVDGRATEIIEGCVRDAITTFEPRLRDVKVKTLEVPRHVTEEVSLEIEGTIVARDESERVIWNSVIKSGHARLTRA